MVFFNYSTMQMAAKVVYYGPGLCGKTTNLQHIYSHTSSGSRGEMVSLETETDRTLFFDLLPLEVGKIQGFKTRIQLYTVPGQVFYNTTRKLVLKGVDGVVFVADSQRAMEQANVESLANLEANLDEIGLTFDDVPIVLQYNKRDLANISTVEEMDASLNGRGWPSFEASALTGEGVFDTLRGISKLTLVGLKKRLTETSKANKATPTPRPAAAVPPPMTGPTVDVVEEPAQAEEPAEIEAATSAPEPSTEEGTVTKSTSRRSGVDILAELEKIRQQSGQNQADQSQSEQAQHQAAEASATEAASDSSPTASETEPAPSIHPADDQDPSGAFEVPAVEVPALSAIDDDPLSAQGSLEPAEGSAVAGGSTVTRSRTGHEDRALGQLDSSGEFDLQPIEDSGEFKLDAGPNLDQPALGAEDDSNEDESNEDAASVDASAALPDRVSGNGRREMEHTVAFHPSREALEGASRISFRLRIEDGNRSVVDTFDEAIQVDDPESIKHLLLNLRIALDPSGNRLSDSDE